MTKGESVYDPLLERLRDLQSLFCASPDSCEKSTPLDTSLVEPYYKGGCQTHFTLGEKRIMCVAHYLVLPENCKSNTFLHPARMQKGG